MGTETIDVVCFVFPDGCTFFMPAADLAASDARQVMDAWKERLLPDARQRYEEAQAMGGFVWLHMLKQDYDALPATSLSHAITKRLEGA